MVPVQALVQQEAVLGELQQALAPPGLRLEALEAPLELLGLDLVAQGPLSVALEVLLAQLAQGQPLEEQDQHSGQQDPHLVPPR